MTQYNLKQGIKKFGDEGKAAVLIELQQLYDRDVKADCHLQTRLIRYDSTIPPLDRHDDAGRAVAGIRISHDDDARPTVPRRETGCQKWMTDDG